MKCINTFIVRARLFWSDLFPSQVLYNHLHPLQLSHGHLLIFQYVESKCTWVGGWKKREFSLSDDDFVRHSKNKEKMGGSKWKQRKEGHRRRMNHVASSSPQLAFLFFVRNRLLLCLKRWRKLMKRPEIANNLKKLWQFILRFKIFNWLYTIPAMAWLDQPPSTL